MATELKYLHINSDHVTKPADTTTKFNVHLSHPIKNCKQVALKSFSTPNTGFNIGFSDNELSWVELYFGSVARARVFTVYLDAGYYTGDELCNHINTKINAMTQRVFVSETQVPIQFTFNGATGTNPYHITVNVGQNNYVSQKAFAPINGSVWQRLGFAPTQMVETENTMEGTKSSANQLIAVIKDTRNNVIEWRSVYTNNSTAPAPFTGVQGAGAYPIVGASVSTVENFSGLFVQTDLAIDSAMETHRRGGLNVAEKSKVLEWIPNNVARYSYLHHNKETVSWCRLHQSEVNDVGISLHNINGDLLHYEQIKQFNMTLVFECDLPNDNSQAVQQVIDSSSYRKNHPVSVFPSGGFRYGA